MGFKEDAFADIQKVFMNPLEFAEEHTVDGKKMMVMIDGMEAVERAKKQSEHGRIDGIYNTEIVLYVSRNEFGPLPAVGESLQLDHTSYRVTDAINEGGVFSITIREFSS